MNAILKNFIAGEWVDGSGVTRNINPSNTNDVVGEYAKADRAQTEKAIAAAKAAFPAWSRSTPQERYDALNKISAEILSRKEELGRLLAREEGKTLPEGIGEVARAGQIFAFFAGEALRLTGEKGASVRPGLDVEITREAVGVVGMITPWNWPLNQIACKVAPALAAGCTMILKPSEFTPTSALIFAEILHEAGVPKGVFNLINGLGPEVGAAMSEHPDIDMISFTGSTRAGIDVAKRAAPTVKRVSQELGGKSPNVILEGADLVKAVTGGVMHMFNNSGQSCNAPSRMIVPAARMKEVAAIAKGVADKTKVGDPRGEGTTIGPVVNRGQWEKIQALINKGIEEGATLVAGGPGLPEGVNKGFYVRPTIFADVKPDM
ncbi:MAG: aldehyde dehydrogenase family protein, partial [Bradyrhizobium sp.]|nr:aldehyde dehydrogenase family protein [Bradyrhizobium sp.]